MSIFSEVWFWGLAIVVSAGLLVIIGARCIVKFEKVEAESYNFSELVPSDDPEVCRESINWYYKEFFTNLVALFESTKGVSKNSVDWVRAWNNMFLEKKALQWETLDTIQNEFWALLYRADVQESLPKKLGKDFDKFKATLYPIDCKLRELHRLTDYRCVRKEERESVFLFSDSIAKRLVKANQMVKKYI